MHHILLLLLLLLLLISLSQTLAMHSHPYYTYIPLLQPLVEGDTSQIFPRGEWSFMSLRQPQQAPLPHPVDWVGYDIDAELAKLIDLESPETDVDVLRDKDKQNEKEKNNTGIDEGVIGNVIGSIQETSARTTDCIGPDETLDDTTDYTTTSTDHLTKRREKTPTSLLQQTEVENHADDMKAPTTRSSHSSHPSATKTITKSHLKPHKATTTPEEKKFIEGFLYAHTFEREDKKGWAVRVTADEMHKAAEEIGWPHRRFWQYVRNYFLRNFDNIRFRFDEDIPIPERVGQPNVEAPNLSSHEKSEISTQWLKCRKRHSRRYDRRKSRNADGTSSSDQNTVALVPTLMLR